MFFEVNIHMYDKRKCSKCGGKSGRALVRYTGEHRILEVEEVLYCPICSKESFEQYKAYMAIQTNIPYFRPDCNVDRLLYDIQDGKCIYCQTQLINGETGTDHIIGVSFDRTKPYMIDVPSNFALACRRCNSSKCNKWYVDWIGRKFPTNAQEVIDRVHRHMAIVRQETGESEWRKSLGIGDEMLYEIR